VNVSYHALNAVLLFWLLKSATGSRWRSLMVAALFALHPINVESVAWAAERKNVLSTFFFLLALYAYIWYARRPRIGAYCAVFGLFALALLAKPQVITFPFLLLLFDYWPLGRFGMTSVGGVPEAAQAARSAPLWKRFRYFCFPRLARWSPCWRRSPATRSRIFPASAWPTDWKPRWWRMFATSEKLFGRRNWCSFIRIPPSFIPSGS
jgi:hypothetical protein